MAGIYIHIPFCKTKCHYCDFYKSTDFSSRTDFLKTLKIEIENRKQEGEGEEIGSIYFGGGTPSVLKIKEVIDIISCIKQHYKTNDDAEITMEANPDDLDDLFISELKNTGVNRLSIGTQSFRDSDLKIMNRRHNSLQAEKAVRLAQESGFDNVSIDLIYGLPNQSLDDWNFNVEKAISLNAQHISAYHLTYHEGTVFYEYLKKGRIKELPDELSFDEFKLLRYRLENSGFEHYEISNFALPGYYSKHNKAYWERKSYIGFGPSAHSFDQRTRRWNISNMNRYMQSVENNQCYWKSEVLSEQDNYNDYIITSLRTKWGISDTYLIGNFPSKYYSHFKKEAKKFIDTGHLISKGGKYILSPEGLFISDKIMEDLFFMEEL